MVFYKWYCFRWYFIKGYCFRLCYCLSGIILDDIVKNISALNYMFLDATVLDGTVSDGTVSNDTFQIMLPQIAIHLISSKLFPNFIPRKKIKFKSIRKLCFRHPLEGE